METKRNSKYFTSKGISPLSIVGLVLFGIGLFLQFSTYKSMSMLFYMIAVGCFVFAVSGSAKETDIDFQVSEKIKDLDERAMIKYEVYEKDFLTIVNPAKLHGYDYVSEGVYFKHGADGKNRTSMYNGVQLFYTEEKLYIHGRQFSLIDDLVDSEFGGVYKYTDLKCADFETREMALPKDRKVTYSVFKILDNNDKPVLYVSVGYGADVDKTIDDINHVIGLAKKNQK